MGAVSLSVRDMRIRWSGSWKSASPLQQIMCLVNQENVITPGAVAEKAFQIHMGIKEVIIITDGVGKTVSTIYPAVQSVGQGRGDKIFYLTAKTITRTVADDTFRLLRERGLHFKSVMLTAKEKICFMQETECNPEYCSPTSEASSDSSVTFSVISSVATSVICPDTSDFLDFTEVSDTIVWFNRVCPFEMCLDMSLFADAVICDYNYLFDPHVYPLVSSVRIPLISWISRKFLTLLSVSIPGAVP